MPETLRPQSRGTPSAALLSPLTPQAPPPNPLSLTVAASTSIDEGLARAAAMSAARRGALCDSGLPDADMCGLELDVGLAGELGPLRDREGGTGAAAAGGRAAGSEAGAGVGSKASARVMDEAISRWVRGSLRHCGAGVGTCVMLVVQCVWRRPAWRGQSRPCAPASLYRCTAC